MTDFLINAPTLDANWRAVVLFGRNVASYKFALAKALLGMAGRADDRVPLEELAAPFARHLCEHLARVDKQTTSRSSRFLDACRAFNRGELAEDRLAEATARLGFNNVIDAFHVVGTGPVPVRFFADERAVGGGAPAIRLTDDLRRLAGSVQGAGLADEAEARWRLVETAWALNLPRAGVAVRADAAAGLLFVERGRAAPAGGRRVDRGAPRGGFRSGSRDQWHLPDPTRPRLGLREPEGRRRPGRHWWAGTEAGVPATGASAQGRRGPSI